jgi:hypothetical protein
METETSLPDTAQLAVVGVALCETSRTLDSWSRLLTGLAVLDFLLRQLLHGFVAFSGGFPAFGLTPLIAVSGFIQVGYALRLAFDRPVFAAWAGHPENATVEKSLGAFDALLKQSGATRPLSERVAGVRRLFRCQLACFAAQVFLLLVLTAFMFWSRLSG